MPNETITPEPTETPEGHATTAETVGEEATASNGGKQTEAERRFSQVDVDRFVMTRLAEEKARLQKRYDKELADKLAAKDTDIEKLVEERLSTALKAKELEAARAEVAREFGLTERQMAVLSGESPEELQAAAEELFGSLRKVAPVVPTGQSGADKTSGVFTRSQLRDPTFFAKHRAEIMRAAGEGRIVED